MQATPPREVLVERDRHRTDEDEERRDPERVSRGVGPDGEPPCSGQTGADGDDGGLRDGSHVSSPQVVGVRDCWAAAGAVGTAGTAGAAGVAVEPVRGTRFTVFQIVSRPGSLWMIFCTSGSS